MVQAVYLHLFYSLDGDGPAKAAEANPEAVLGAVY